MLIKHNLNCNIFRISIIPSQKKQKTFLYYSCPDYEYGCTFHSIIKFQEITLGDNLIDGDYESVRKRTPQKVKDYQKEKAELYSYKRKSDGKPYNCIPFAEMTPEEEEIGRKLDNLWKKYQQPVMRTFITNMYIVNF